MADQNQSRIQLAVTKEDGNLLITIPIPIGDEFQLEGNTFRQQPGKKKIIAKSSSSTITVQIKKEQQ